MNKQKILEAAFELIADELGDNPYEYIDDQKTVNNMIMAIWGIVRATKATLETIKKA